jgi:hypothetical protein
MNKMKSLGQPLSHPTCKTGRMKNINAVCGTGRMRMGGLMPATRLCRHGHLSGRKNSIQPRMDTEEHGFNPPKKELWLTENETSTVAVSGKAKKASFSSPIRVHQCSSVVKTLRFLLFKKSDALFCVIPRFLRAKSQISVHPWLTSVSFQPGSTFGRLLPRMFAFFFRKSFPDTRKKVPTDN